MAKKTNTARPRREGPPPGLRRLRKAKNAEAIRSAVLADQETGRAAARAKIEAAKAAKAAPAAKPATAAHSRPTAAVTPTPIPEVGMAMMGMSPAQATLYMRAAAGKMPTPPDFSKPSYAPDRKRLAALVALAEAGDAAGLRAYSIKAYYSAAVAMDRFRHRAILAIEAQSAGKA